ncbi:MAG: DUF389 domain-containing protein [Aggregatilineales bacterium]
MSEKKPDYARNIVVPIARPASALHLLELAVSLIDPEEGKVYAVTVSTGDEKINDTLEALQPIIDDFIERGHNVEMVTEIAASITRGILDATREYGADILILGVHQAERRQVKLGSVVENIIEAATCDVLVYRPGESPDYDRVMVPIDGTYNCTVALNIAANIAHSHDAPLVPLYIQRDYRYRQEYESLISNTLNTLDSGLIQKDVIFGTDPATRILNDAGENDLMVLGFEQKQAVDPQFERDMTVKLLNRAPGPVVIASRLPFEENMVGHLQRRLQRFNPALTQVERSEIVWLSQRNAMASIDYLVLILLSAGLASFGLLANSVAVIIGAMLVAPLMSPLAALSTGLITGRPLLIRRAGVTLIQGVLLALLVSIVAGLMIPLDTPTSEILARGNPSLLDAAVAVVSGWVAAYATARRNIPAALAGVAIAAALMPPVCTIGLGIALGRPALAFGATLLFTTNIVFIVVSQYMIFLWVGMRPGRANPDTQVRLWWAVIGALLLLVVGLLAGLGRQAVDEAAIEEFLIERFAPAEAVDLNVVTGDELLIQYTIRTVDIPSPSDIAEAEQTLTLQLQQPANLELSIIPLVRPVPAQNLIIENTLNEIFTPGYIVSLRIDREEARLLIDATLNTTMTPNSRTIRQAQDAVQDVTDIPVTLRLVIQEMIQIEVTVEPEATATPDSGE